MSDVGPETQPSLMQFSLKGVLVVTAVFAVIFAATVPLVRLLGEEQQLRLGVFLVGNLVVGLWIAVHLCRKRYDLESKCGQRLVCLVTTDRLRQAWEIGGGVVIAVMLLPLVLDSPSTTWPYFGAIAFGANSGLYISRGVLRLWWGGVMSGAELCEHGVIISGVVFRSWMDTYVYRWDKQRGVLVLNSRQAFMTYRAASKDRDCVDQIVAEHGVGRSSGQER